MQASQQADSRRVCVILNADDFGLSAEIDAGILALLAKGRLTGVSMMPTGPLFAANGPKLTAYADRADIGLHFTLTEMPTLRAQGLRRADGTPHTFGEVQSRAWRRDLDGAAVLDELERQWRAVRDSIGRPPSHIDSHQHIHQLPIVRDAVVAFVARQPVSERPYVRTAAERTGVVLRRGVDSVRALAFAWMARGVRKRLAAQRCQTNEGFTGVYDFSTGTAYRERFRRFVRGARDNTILLCHPAMPGSSGCSDPIGPARVAEFAYFSGEEMPGDLAAANVRLGRFDEARRSP